MANIQFKAKIRTVYNMDDSPAWQYVECPDFKRHHCDMPAFRDHPKFGVFANSDLFLNVLSRVKKDIAPNGTIRLDRLPPNVVIDNSGFLAVVTISV